MKTIEYYPCHFCRKPLALGQLCGCERETQAISFVYGMLKLSNPETERETVASVVTTELRTRETP